MLLFLGRKLFKKEQDGGNGGLSLQVCSVSKKVLHLEQFDASGMVKLPNYGGLETRVDRRSSNLCAYLSQASSETRVGRELALAKPSRRQNSRAGGRLDGLTIHSFDLWEIAKLGT